jgi:hypothetical protein
VRRAEDGCMYIVLRYLIFHILKVHTPHAIFVKHEGTENYIITAVFKGMRKSHIDRSVNEDVISAGAKGIDGGNDSAENAVFISDMLGAKALDAVSGLLPLYD